MQDQAERKKQKESRSSRNRMDFKIKKRNSIKKRMNLKTKQTNKIINQTDSRSRRIQNLNKFSRMKRAFYAQAVYIAERKKCKNLISLFPTDRYTVPFRCLDLGGM